MAELEVASETLRIESKVYYSDLRANGRGCFVRLSERAGSRPTRGATGSSPTPPPSEGGGDEAATPPATATAPAPEPTASRNVVCLPGPALPWFSALLAYYAEREPSKSSSNRELPVENKIFFFELGENTRGRFLRISENGAGPRGRSSLLIPAGAPAAAPAWAALRDVLLRAQAAAWDYHYTSGLAAAGVPPPPPPTATADPHLVAAIAGPSPVVGPGPAPPTIAPTPSGGCLVRAGHKRFFFDANQNLKGGYLRISEVAGSDRTSIIVPAWALPQVVAAAGAFLGPLCGPGGGAAAAAAGGALAASGGVGGPPPSLGHMPGGGGGGVGISGGIGMGWEVAGFAAGGGGFHQQAHPHHPHPYQHTGFHAAGGPPPGRPAFHAHRAQAAVVAVASGAPPKASTSPPSLDSLSLAPGGPTAARASAAVAAAAAAAASHRAAAAAAAAAAMAPAPLLTGTITPPTPVATDADPPDAGPAEAAEVAAK